MAEKEYIERGALLNKILYGNADSIVLRGYAVDMVKSVPAADVVEVVRCKDCKKYSNFDPNNCKRLTFHFCNKFGNITKENDFCSYGERKEKNG